MNRLPALPVFLAVSAMMLFTGPGLAFGQNTISLSDAVRNTLEMNQEVRIERERVIQRRGFHQAASGPFDWMFSSVVERESSRGPTPDADAIQSVTQDFYALGISKQLRNGMLITPRVSVTQADNILSSGPVGVSSVNLSLTVPLLRDRGARNTAADERAASADLDGAVSLQIQHISERVFNTAITFYDCLAAYERLQVLKEAEELTLESMDTVRRMITAAILDPGDMLQAQAVVASKQADRRAGEQSLYRRRLSLAAAMGYPSENIPDAPLAGGTFPQPIASRDLEAVSRTEYIRNAMNYRGDYRASLKNIESEDILLQRAENARRTRLDLNVGAGYTGFDTGSGAGRPFRALYNNPIGPNVIVGMRMSLPLGNNAALGHQAVREASLREAQQQSDRLSTLITHDILAAHEDLRSAIDRYQLVLTSEQIFQNALDHESKKLTTGQSSLTEVLQIQDRYVGVRLAKIDAQREYAAAMARFRLVTGTLLGYDEDGVQFDMSRLLTLPFTEGADTNEP